MDKNKNGKSKKSSGFQNTDDKRGSFEVKQNKKQSAKGKQKGM